MGLLPLCRGGGRDLLAPSQRSSSLRLSARKNFLCQSPREHRIGQENSRQKQHFSTTASGRSYAKALTPDSCATVGEEDAESLKERFDVGGLEQMKETNCLFNTTIAVAEDREEQEEGSGRKKEEH